MFLLKLATILPTFLCLASLPSMIKAQELTPMDIPSTGYTTTSPETSPPVAEPALPYKYVGNSFSLKFHRPSCPFAKAMSLHHVQLHHFRKQAVQAGQKPCKYCLPPNWKEVHASLLPADPQRWRPPSRLCAPPDVLLPPRPPGLTEPPPRTPEPIEAPPSVPP